MLARVASATVLGIQAAPIDVEVDFAVGLPGCHIVGLPDAGVKEGRLRIRGALENSGFKLPSRRITVNLAPADLRKDGAAFDVPIAVGMLCAAGMIAPEQLDDAVFV
ncbi:MAG: magnesium chelatase domain-containing protein, partial [Polyangia bacterium]